MKKILFGIVFRMDRFEEGLEKLQEIKGEVKDRIKDVKGRDKKYS